MKPLSWNATALLFRTREYRRRPAVTDPIQADFCAVCAKKAIKENIFYYVYNVLLPPLNVWPRRSLALFDGFHPSLEQLTDPL